MFRRFGPWSAGFGLKGFAQDRARMIINRWQKGDDEVLKSISEGYQSSDFVSLPNRFPESK